MFTESSRSKRPKKVHRTRPKGQIQNQKVHTLERKPAYNFLIRRGYKNKVNLGVKEKILYAKLISNAVLNLLDGVYV